MELDKEMEWKNSVFLEIEEELMKDEDDEVLGQSSTEFCDKFVAEVLGEEDEPAAKKRTRQMRNRDAAVRSRERKKEYVKELEMKSRFLEAECRRLSRLLQCCYADNHFLRHTAAKQESAVLLLESLLLGSLLWWLVTSHCLPNPLNAKGLIDISSFLNPTTCCKASRPNINPHVIISSPLSIRFPLFFIFFIT